MIILNVYWQGNTPTETVYANFPKASINANEEIRQPRHYYCHIIEILITGNMLPYVLLNVPRCCCWCTL